MAAPRLESRPRAPGRRRAGGDAHAVSAGAAPRRAAQTRGVLGWAARFLLSAVAACSRAPTLQGTCDQFSVGKGLIFPSGSKACPLVFVCRNCELTILLRVGYVHPHGRVPRVPHRPRERGGGLPGLRRGGRGGATNFSSFRFSFSITDTSARRRTRRLRATTTRRRRTGRRPAGAG